MATTTQTSPSQVCKLHTYGLVSQGDGTYRLGDDRIDADLDIDSVQEFRDSFGDIYNADCFEIADDAGRPNVHAWDDAWTCIAIRDVKTGEIVYDVLVPMWEDR